MDHLDQELLNHLRQNSRATTSALSRTLGVSRSTIQDRIKRLEERGIIKGYTLIESEDYSRTMIRAHVMIQIGARYQSHIVTELKRLKDVQSVHTVSGVYDLIAVVRAENTAEIDCCLDQVGSIKGVEKTTSSIILSTKFDRFG